MNQKFCLLHPVIQVLISGLLPALCPHINCEAVADHQSLHISFCVSLQYGLYMPVHIQFVFFFPTPVALEAPSDSHGSCKMKVTALFHVTIPTLRFLFHWLQTPDFSESKNRLLQTLTPPSRCSLTPFHFFPPFRLLLGSLTALCLVFASMCQTKPYVSIQSGV